MLGLGPRGGILAQVENQIAAYVGGEEDQGVLEVDDPALAVFHPALVKDLEEDLVHVRMGLFHLVEQHHAVGAPAHRLGQHAAFAVADITRGRAFQRGHGVRFLEFAHVDGDGILLTAVQGLGQGQRGFGLPHA